MQDKKLVSAPLQAEKFCKEIEVKDEEEVKTEEELKKEEEAWEKKAFKFVYFADFESFTKND